MGNPITWRGTTAKQPDFRGAAAIIGQGGDTLRRALNGGQDIIDGFQGREDTQTDKNTAAFVTEIQNRFRSPEELEDARASGAIDEIRQSYASLNEAGSNRAVVDSFITKGRDDEIQKDVYNEVQRTTEARPIRESWANIKASGDEGAMAEHFRLNASYKGRAEDLESLTTWKKQQDTDARTLLIQGQADRQHARTLAIQAQGDADDKRARIQAPQIEEIRQHIINKNYGPARAMLKGLELDEESTLHKELAAAVSGDVKTAREMKLQAITDENDATAQQTVRRNIAIEEEVLVSQQALTQSANDNYQSVLTTTSDFQTAYPNVDLNRLDDWDYMKDMEETDFTALLKYTTAMDEFNTNGADDHVQADLYKKLGKMRGIKQEEIVKALSKYDQGNITRNKQTEFTDSIIQAKKDVVNEKEQYRNNDAVAELKDPNRKSPEGRGVQLHEEFKLAYEEMKGFNKNEIEEFVDTMVYQGIPSVDEKGKSIFIKPTMNQARLILHRLTEGNLLERNAMAEAKQMVKDGAYDANREAAKWEAEMKAIDQNFGSQYQRGQQIGTPAWSFRGAKAQEIRAQDVIDKAAAAKQDQINIDNAITDETASAAATDAALAKISKNTGNLIMGGPTPGGFVDEQNAKKATALRLLIESRATPETDH